MWASGLCWIVFLLYIRNLNIGLRVALKNKQQAPIAFCWVFYIQRQNFKQLHDEGRFNIRLVICLHIQDENKFNNI
jgi:hypothetical protein